MAKNSNDADSQSRFAGPSDVLLAAIVNSSDDAIISKDLSGTITSWNPAAERIFGYKASEVIGGPISVIIPPDRGHEEIDILSRISRGESINHFETVRVAKNGAPVELSVTISPLHHQGKIIGASKVARVISDQKRLERELEYQRSRLEATLQSIGDAVIVTKTDGSVAFMNGVAETLTEWPIEDAVNKPLEAVFNIVNERTRARVENPAIRALREGTIVGLANHTVLIGKNGAEYAVDDTAAPIRNSANEILGSVLVFRDVSAARAAADFRARLAAIVQSSDDAIVSKDLNGRITSWNPAAVRLFGYSPDEVVGRPISILIPPERLHEETEILSRIRRGERVDHFQTVRLTKDRASVHVSLTISPIHNLEGEVVGASKIARDVTAQIQTERDLREARERLQKHSQELESTVTARTAELQAAYDDLEAFSYTVAHDLRAPVRGMTGLLTLLQDQIGAGGAPAELVHKLFTTAKRLDVLIEDLLKLSRLSKKSLERRAIHLGDLVRRAIDDLKLDAEGRKVRWEIHPLPVAACDPGLIQQVFVNLLSNALKFTRPRPVAEIEIGEVSSADGALVYVRDNGVGFKKEHASKLFAAFRRLHSDRQFEGTGIGLVSVHRIIVKHGGRIWAESDEGRGATFYFTLPSAVL